jgi:hypothetical protein
MREVAMDVFGDRRFWYAAALIVVVVIAFVIWSRSKTEGPHSPATTTEAPAKTSPPSPTPESPPK